MSFSFALEKVTEPLCTLISLMKIQLKISRCGCEDQLTPFSIIKNNTNHSINMYHLITDVFVIYGPQKSYRCLQRNSTEN